MSKSRIDSNPFADQLGQQFYEPLHRKLKNKKPLLSNGEYYSDKSDNANSRVELATITIDDMIIPSNYCSINIGSDVGCAKDAKAIGVTPILEHTSGSENLLDKIQQLFNDIKKNMANKEFLLLKSWPVMTFIMLMADIIEHRDSKYIEASLFGRAITHNLAIEKHSLVMNMRGDLGGIIAAPMCTLAAFLIEEFLRSKNKRTERNRMSVGSKLTYSIYLIYAVLRYISTIVDQLNDEDKIQKSQEEIQCDAKYGIYRYVAEVAEKMCLACDWDDINLTLSEKLSSQLCLNSVMIQEGDVKAILDKLNRIVLLKDFKDIKFSSKQLLAWSNDDFGKLLNKLSSISQPLDKIDFSLEPFQATSNINGKIESIVKFISHINFQKFLFRNQIADASYILPLAKIFPNVTAHLVDFTNTLLGDGAYNFSNNLKLTNISALILENTGYDALKLPGLINGITASKVNLLNLNNNDFSTENVFYLSQKINQTILENLSLNYIASGAQISAQAWMALGYAIADFSLLKIFNIAGNKLRQEDIQSLAPIRASNLTEISFANNVFSFKRTANIFFEILPSTLVRLDLTGIRINADGMPALIKFINRAKYLINLVLSENDYTNEGLKALFTAIVESNIETIVLANCNLDEEKATTIADVIKSNSNNKLKNIIVPDNSISGSGSILIESNDIFEFINMTNNALTADVTRRSSKSFNSLRIIDISGNPNIKGSDFSRLIEGSKNSALEKVIAKNIGTIELKDALSISGALLNLPFDQAILLQPLQKENIQALDKTSRLTNITSIEADTLSDRTAIPFCNIVPASHLNQQSLYMNGSLLYCQSSSASRTEMSSCTILLTNFMLLYFLYQLLSQFAKPLTYHPQRLFNHKKVSSSEPFNNLEVNKTFTNTK